MIGADSCQKKIKVMTCDIPKTTVRIGQTRLDFAEARPALNSRASRSRHCRVRSEPSELVDTRIGSHFVWFVHAIPDALRSATTAAE